VTAPRTPAPARVTWVVELLDVQPGDEVLEIGGAPGVAVALVCERLDGGRITAIDRSATGVERIRQRNAEHVAAGRAMVEQVDLADFQGEADRFDKVFAVNVNVFWTIPADSECQALARVLRPGGALHLVYGGPTPDATRDVGPVVAANLARHGFTPKVLHHPTEPLLCITAHT
jgi:protein-L-isoaspartate O-methyltransferase